ncbi:hypothetical protein RAS1_43650 [Phycisphaerae bacterium RAS1]|nr:hypothetical protein RAS1_43650 [Phycisphaerae bacterium RAS1]
MMPTVVRRLLLIGVLWVCVWRSAAQIPPGYQVVQVTQNPNWETRASINNRGQIVFEHYFDTYDSNTAEIFLYDHGVLRQLTNDYVCDRLPDINDNGVVVWSRFSGTGKTGDIAMLSDGVMTILTHDAVNDYEPHINNAGHVSWSKLLWLGCGGSEANVYLYDGANITTIIADGLSNQGVRVNDYDELTWTRYNFCNDPWTSEVMVYSGGVIKPLTTWQFAAVAGDISNSGMVTWFYRRLPDYQNILQCWKDGSVVTLTEWGSNSWLNNNDDVFFDRWYEDSQTWQVWLLRGGQFLQLSADPFWNWTGGINDHGELAWMSGNPYEPDVRWLRRPPDGDLNCDGGVSVTDINAFVLALTSPSGYRGLYPLCDVLLADMNGDLSANVLDINEFVAAVGAGR